MNEYWISFLVTISYLHSNGLQAALSALQTKAGEEISKAQRLISEKDAELDAAEESLTGLKEVRRVEIYNSIFLPNLAKDSIYDAYRYEKQLLEFLFKMLYIWPLVNSLEK